MSLEWRLICDGCGRHQSGADLEIPKNWSTVGARTTTHYCEDCAPPKAHSGLTQRLWHWYLRNPALALMTANCVILMIAIAVGSVVCAVQFRRLHTRIAELEQARQALLHVITGLPRR
jgi:hypothetical protein